VPEIPEEMSFIIGEDGAKFTTQSNGDILILSGFHVSKEQAATLAYLINSKKQLDVRVKAK
jgi:hypothetical protein